MSEMEMCSFVTATSNMTVEENQNTKLESGTNDQQKVQSCIENIVLNHENLDENDIPIDVYELDELNELCSNNNLPEGWIKFIHTSGMPVYMNKNTKVCSFSKPYFLGVNSLKNHDIPVKNIPCLDYKLRLQKYNALNDDDSIVYPELLKHEQYREFCKKIFKFKNIKFMRFSSWDKRREYIRMIKADRRRKDLPKLQTMTQSMSFPLQQAKKNTIETQKCNSNPSNSEDEWTINLNGKSYVSILHEYIQRVLKTQPLYEFKELENARYPYLATVILDGMQYGIGIGSSKKQAKLDSARATLQILLPSVKDHIPINRRLAMNERQGGHFDGDSIFDKLKIKDSRIPEFCAQAAESMPYDMLQICVKRNFGEDASVICDMQSMQSGSDSEIFYRCTMNVKEHSATVICKNKREGRQKGAQALLKVLHPHISYFGSLLRLYSHQNIGNGCEKKLDEPGSQSPKPRSGPNDEILKQLKIEMSKLEEI